MTREYKCKIIDKWFNEHIRKCNVYGVEYDGVLIDWYRRRIRYLVRWHETYQLLTVTDMYSAALTRTFYMDTNQVDELIHIITDNKHREK